MERRGHHFDWMRVRAFLATAEEGSLSAASRHLGLGQPTLGRQVAALEEELGVSLFERIGRRLVLTDAGRSLLPHARAMGEAADRLSLAAIGHAETVEGRVVVSASEAIAAFILPPIIARLAETAPGITVEVVASATLSDLARREADIAIRNIAPEGDDLMARRLKDGVAYLYCARTYLDACGDLDDLTTLAGAKFIGFGNDREFIDALRQRGVTVGPDCFITGSRSHLVHWAMVREGLGVGVMASAVGDADPAVVRVGCGLDPFDYPIWLVAHRELRTSRRVRLVFDHFATELNAI